MAARAPAPPWCTVSDTLQFGHSSVARALAAEHGGREAAPVQQHDRLLAGARAARPIASHSARAEDDVRARRGVLLAHVDDAHGGQRAIEHAPLEREQRVASALRVVKALERRRRRAEDDERAGLAAANDRDVAAVIARALLLLVRAVVLLVDDDQPERPQRREDRRARADDDVDVAAADALPLVVTLAVGQPAVLDRDAVAERRAEDAPRPPASARSPAPASARRGRARARASASRRYSSVLPLPVTPCSRTVGERAGRGERRSAARKRLPVLR